MYAGNGSCTDVKMYSRQYRQPVRLVERQVGWKSYISCTRCGRPLMDTKIIVVKDNDNQELAFLGKECVKKLK